MASNPYVNKVIYGNQTIIDITDTTATAADVAAGKYFYTADGAKVQGTSAGGSVIIVETADPHGGTVVNITSREVVTLQTSKSVTPSLSAQTVTPDAGYDGLLQVNVAAMDVSKYYTGTSSPSSSLGSNGDIYLRTSS